MSTDKAIPTRPLIPGATVIRDRDGADVTLFDNTIKLNTLGDNSSILITSPFQLQYPSNNFVTLNPPSNTKFSNVVLTNPNTTLIGNLPTNEPTTSFDLRPTSKEIAEVVIETTPTLPDIEPGFTSIYLTNIKEVTTTNDYIGLEAGIEPIQPAGQYNGQTSGYSAKWSDLDAAKQNTAKQLYKTLTKDFKFTELEAKVILGIISKESLFTIKQPENLYYTSTKRLREVFKGYIRVIQTGPRKGQSKKIIEWTDEELSWLLKNAPRVGNFIYGQVGLGNTPSTNWDDPKQDGYKFRGRTYNGLTFKGTYQKYQDLYNSKNPSNKIDIIKNPDLLNAPPLAFAITGLYFLESKKTWPPSKGGYNLTDVKDAIYYFIRVNAGWGTFNGKYTSSNNVILEGASKAQAFYESIKNINLN